MGFKNSNGQWYDYESNRTIDDQLMGDGGHLNWFISPPTCATEAAACKRMRILRYIKMCIVAKGAC